MTDLLRRLTGEKIPFYHQEESDEEEFEDSNEVDETENQIAGNIVQYLNEEEHWVVHAILKNRLKQDGENEYLVAWKKIDADEELPEENIDEEYAEYEDANNNNENEMKIIRFDSRTNAHKEDENLDLAPNRFKILWMNVHDLEYHGILLARQYDREKKQRILKLRRNHQIHHKMQESTRVEKDLSWVYEDVPVGIKPSQEVEPVPQQEIKPRKERSRVTSLSSLCIQSLAHNLLLYEGFEEIPILFKAQIFMCLVKQRTLTSQHLATLLDRNQKTLHLSMTNYLIFDEHLLRIGEICSQLTSLNLKDCKSITDVGMASVMQGCHQITELILEDCSELTSGCCAHLGKSFPNLKILNLKGCKKIGHLGLRALAVTAKNLEVLDLSKMSNFSSSNLFPFSVLMFLLNCRELKVLRASDTVGPYSFKKEKKLKEQMEELEQAHFVCTKLEELELLDSNWITWTWGTFVRERQILNNLKKLSIGTTTSYFQHKTKIAACPGCKEELTGIGWNRRVQWKCDYQYITLHHVMFPNIEQLVLQNIRLTSYYIPVKPDEIGWPNSIQKLYWRNEFPVNYYYSNGTSVPTYLSRPDLVINLNVLTQCNNLKELSLLTSSENSGSSLYQIMENNLELEQITLEGFADSTFDLVVRAFKKLRNLKKLRLNMVGNGVAFQPHQFTQHQLNWSKVKLPFNQIEKLELLSCSWLDLLPTSCLFSHSPCIKEIYLKGCARINNSAVQEIFKNLPNLQKATLENLDALSDDLWQNLKSEKVEELSLKSVFVKARNIEMIAANFPALLKLQLSNTKTNPDGVGEIARTMPQLEELKLECLPKLDKDDLKPLKALFHLDSLEISYCSLKLDKQEDFPSLQITPSFMRWCMDACRIVKK